MHEKERNRGGIDDVVGVIAVVARRIRPPRWPPSALLDLLRCLPIYEHLGLQPGDCNAVVPAAANRSPRRDQKPRSGMSGARCSQLSGAVGAPAIDDVQRVGVARARRAVGRAAVRQQTVQDDQRALRHLERHQPVARQRRRIERDHLGPVVRPADVAADEAARSGPLWPPGAAYRQPFRVVASSSANHRPTHARRLGVQEARVLVTADLAADPRLLEDVHRLQQQGLGDAELGHQRGQRRLAREALEDRVEIVQRVADLVDRARLALPQPALSVERLLLEEEADPVAGLEEVAVLGVAVLARREDGRDLGRLEGLQQLGHARAQRVALLAPARSPAGPDSRRARTVCRWLAATMAGASD